MALTEVTDPQTLEQLNGFGSRFNAAVGSGMGRLGNILFPAAPNTDPETQKAAQSQALLTFGLGLMAGRNRSGAGLGSSLFDAYQASSQNYRGAMDNAFRNTLIKRREEREEKQAELQQKAAEREARQTSATTAGRLSQGLGGAQDPMAYWKLVQGMPEVQDTLKAYGIDPAAVTPETLPQISQQLAAAGQVSGPASPALTPTDDIREYAFAQSQGYQGTFADYLRDMKRAGATTVNLGSQGLSTPPTGYYRPNPTQPGLNVEPGGPVETERNKPTGENRIAAGYLGRMNHAEQLIGEFVPNVKDFTLAGTVLTGNAPMAASANKLMSKDAQAYYQAASDWVRAKLRKESGAVISKEEMLAEIRTYFPVPGDPPGLVAQKAQARQIAAQAMREQAGPAAASDGWKIEKVK